MGVDALKLKDTLSVYWKCCMLCRTIGFSALKLIPTQSISLFMSFNFCLHTGEHLCDLIDKKMFFLPDSKLLAKFTCAVKIHMRFPRIISPCFVCIILPCFVWEWALTQILTRDTTGTLIHLSLKLQSLIGDFQRLEVIEGKCQLYFYFSKHE